MSVCFCQAIKTLSLYQLYAEFSQEFVLLRKGFEVSVPGGVLWEREGSERGGAALSQVRQPMSFRFFIPVSIFQVCWAREEVWLARTVPGDEYCRCRALQLEKDKVAEEKLCVREVTACTLQASSLLTV